MSESRQYEDYTAAEQRQESVPAKESETNETIVYSEEKPINRKAIRIRRFLTSFGIFLFLLICVWSTLRLRSEAQEIDQSIAKIEEQISEEKAKTLEYRVEQNYYQSDQYKERMARNRFRLIFPGEVLIQVN